MSIEQNKATVRRFIDDVVNGAHPERAKEFTGPEFVLRFPGESPTKVDELPRFFSKLRTSFPDMHIQIDEMIAEGDWVGALITLTGTHRGVFQGVAPTAKAFRIPGELFYRLHNGKIIESRPMFDRLAMLEQLGVKQEKRAA